MDAQDIREEALRCRPPPRRTRSPRGDGAPRAELCSGFGVLEPLQSAASPKAQVEELRLIVQENADPPLILVGYSWGAWLGFMFAAAYPELVRKLVLIGSPPFTDAYAGKIMETRLGRLDGAGREAALSAISDLEDPKTGDKNAIMARLGELLSEADSYDPLPEEGGPLACDYNIYKRVWAEAARLRSSGRLLAFGKKIRCPVVAIHGDHDPHPSEGVRVPLSAVLADFRFILLADCGHCPWKERKARGEFYEVLKREIRGIAGHDGLP